MKYLKSCLLVFIVLFGCAHHQKAVSKQPGVNQEIEYAILDFSNKSRLFKKDSVFSVSIYEVSDKSLLVVRIGRNNTKLLISSAAGNGHKWAKIPTRFLEKEEKLFFWYDDHYPLTEEATNVFTKYNLLQDDESGLITVPDFTTGESQQAAHYYFCKNDLSKFKRVITSKGIGYYTPPMLKCK